MTATLLEIVELENGEVALCSQNESEPLLVLRFSENAKKYLKEDYLAISEIMLEAGIKKLVLKNTEESPKSLQEIKPSLTIH